MAVRTLGRVLAVLALLAPASAARVVQVDVREEPFDPGSGALVERVMVTCVRVTAEDDASARAMAAEFDLTPHDGPESSCWDVWVGWLGSGPEQEPVSLCVDACRASQRVA